MGILELIIVLLFVMWLLGFVFVPVGNLIHVLLVIVLILIVIRLLQGRRVL